MSFPKLTYIAGLLQRLCVGVLFIVCAQPVSGQESSITEGMVLIPGARSKEVVTVSDRNTEPRSRRFTWMRFGSISLKSPTKNLKNYSKNIICAAVFFLTATTARFQNSIGMKLRTIAT